MEAPIIYLPMPIPMPMPAPTPGVVVPTAPSPGIGIPIPSLVPSGSVTQPFADLFNFPVDWRYILAILLLLVTISIAESWNPQYAWYYVAILLLGALLVNDKTRKAFPGSLDALIRATKGQ